MTTQKYAEVILPFPLDGTYTYIIPENLENSIRVGIRVVVPFGKNKQYSGIIESIHQNKPTSFKPKEILDTLDESPIVRRQHLNFWEWIAEYYSCHLGEVMANALPSYLKLQSETSIHLDIAIEKVDEIDDVNEDEILILEALSIKQKISLKEAGEISGVKNPFPLVNSLRMKGYVIMEEELNNIYKPKKQRYIYLDEKYQQEDEMHALLDKLERAPVQSNLILAYLHLEDKQSRISRKALLKKSGSSAGSLKSLIDKGILIETEETIDRIPDTKNSEPETYLLSSAQIKALETINIAFRKHTSVLLHGITGSGKTLLYAELIKQISSKGQVLYLVPEIALSAQLIKRLRKILGSEIGIYHSKFNPNERVEIWNKVLKNEYKIIVGVRSALFLPFQNLELIIVDEEHESTYKQHDPAPRYNARDAAVWYAHANKAKILLGSATPSFESLYNAENGKYGYVYLGQRFSEVQLPEMEIIDLVKNQSHKSMKGTLSRELFEALLQNKEDGFQSILFQNRRGFSTLLQCRHCGWIPGCNNCDISLTYHKYSNELKCHYCGFKEKIPSKCPECGSHDLSYKGFGTEQVEEDLSVFFEEMESLRLDQDSTGSKDAFQKIITAFENGEADVLLGTQMVTKGLDFERVNLVGILNADLLINFPDFRAAERSFQLITQVSGRAGRRLHRGKVLIQTYNPKNQIFKLLKDNDYLDFYKKEMIERKQFQYPPYYRLIKISVKHGTLNTVRTASFYLSKNLKRIRNITILGPEPALVARVRNRYIYEILVKVEKDINYGTLKKYIRQIISDGHSEETVRRSRIIIDVDPH